MSTKRVHIVAAVMAPGPCAAPLFLDPGTSRSTSPYARFGRRHMTGAVDPLRGGGGQDGRWRRIRPTYEIGDPKQQRAFYDQFGGMDLSGCGTLLFAVDDVRRHQEPFCALVSSHSDGPLLSSALCGVKACLDDPHPVSPPKPASSLAGLQDELGGTRLT